jgi:hypothetical protein
MLTGGLMAESTKAPLSYRPSLVTFLDVLGFRETVKNLTCEQVGSILDQVERFTDARRNPNEDDDLDEDALDLMANVVAFSDSIVRVRPIDTEWHYGALWSEILSLVHVQGELIQYGVILRGGIALGDAFISGSRVFGPGMIAAYEMESMYAKYPRIVISPQVLLALKSDSRLRGPGHSFEFDQEEILRLVRKSDDGLWFVDYLQAIEEELDDVATYANVLKEHKNLILRSVSERGATLDSVVSKHMWLARYHNQVVSEIEPKWFKEYNVKKDDLQINHQEFPILNDFGSGEAPI